MERRSLPVPDGLVGDRVDAALAKMLGFSRSFAAEIAADRWNLEFLRQPDEVSW